MSATPGSAAEGGATGSLPVYRRIVVPLDGSQLSELALPHAERLARLSGAELVVLRCYRAAAPAEPTETGATLARRALAPTARPATPARPDEGPLADAVAARRERNLRHRIDRYLDDVAERLRSDGVPVEVVRLEGPADRAIVAEAAARAADLIVMATHARGAIGRMLVGSVADRVVHHAPCPVLLVRPER